MGNTDTFPPREILDPPKPLDRWVVGYCVFCGGSLGKPYQENLFHIECLTEAEDSEDD
jgi:hypothetical protein